MLQNNILRSTIILRHPPPQKVENSITMRCPPPEKGEEMIIVPHPPPEKGEDVIITVSHLALLLKRGTRE
jgi:hypothetical protein